MQFKKKTKIIATLGPSTSDQETILNLAKAGTNAFRLNFSHGKKEDHKVLLNAVKWAEKELDRPLPIILDLCGPKIRLGDLAEDEVVLSDGDSLIVSSGKFVGTKEKIAINYPNFSKEVKEGERVLIDDGKLELKVEFISQDGETTLRIISGGIIKGRRGVNLPDSDLSISSLTEKDKIDLDFAFENPVSYIALSFVRRPSDILELRKVMKEKNISAGIVAKIETKEAVSNLDEIIKLADAIMVARGDLAVEINPENVPILQKNIIQKCNQAGKLVITATQMLESMVSASSPTRAEVSDVANAILDGTDAVMLSQETAIGAYPVKAVQAMARIAVRLEGDVLHRQTIDWKLSRKGKGMDVADAISHSVVSIAEEVKTPLILVLTESGFTGRMVSRFRPSQPIIVLTPNESVFRQLALFFGCYPVLIQKINHTSELFEWIKNFIPQIAEGVKIGDKITIASGVPFGHGSKTNSVMVVEV